MMDKPDDGDDVGYDNADDGDDACGCGNGNCDDGVDGDYYRLITGEMGDGDDN